MRTFSTTTAASFRDKINFPSQMSRFRPGMHGVQGLRNPGLYMAYLILKSLPNGLSILLWPTRNDGHLRSAARPPVSVGSHLVRRRRPAGIPRSNPHVAGAVLPSLMHLTRPISD